jgi:hypothetical protein
MNVSLTKFCKDHNLPKATVYRKAQELGFSTSDGLSPEAVDRLTIEFNLITEPQPQPQPEPQGIQVEVGNHAMVLASPIVPTQYSLDSLRQDQAVTIANPLEIAQQMIAASKSLAEAMANDLECRKLQLEQTRKAREAIAAQAQKLEIDARFYSIQANQLDSSVTAETTKLTEELETLKKLSQPATDGSV